MIRPTTFPKLSACVTLCRKNLITQVLCGAFLFAAPHVSAQELRQCFPYPQVAASLGSVYAEAPVIRGLHSSGAFVFEVWGNSQTGTWTAFVVRPDGMACPVAGGVSMDIVIEKAGGDGPDA